LAVNQRLVFVGDASARDGVSSYDLVSGQCLQTFSTPSRSVKALVLHGKFLFVGSLDGVVRTFDRDSGTLLRTLEVEDPSDWVYALLVVRDQNGSLRLVRGGRHGTLIALDAHTCGKVAATPPQPGSSKLPTSAAGPRVASDATPTTPRWRSPAPRGRAKLAFSEVASRPARGRHGFAFRGDPVADQELWNMTREEVKAYNTLLRPQAPLTGFASTLPPGQLRGDGRLVCDLPGCLLLLENEEELAVHCQETDHADVLARLSQSKPPPEQLFGLGPGATKEEVGFVFCAAGKPRLIQVAGGR
jgi:hypothetical protein